MKICPCGFDRDYSNCCEPYIKGKVKAPTAEAFMRSRYSAYVMHEIDYIINTYIQRDNVGVDVKATREMSEKSKWLGLNIIAVEKGSPADTVGYVEFEAVYERDGQKNTHHEKSKFVKENDQWLYLDGRISIRNSAHSSAKIGRNEPCPCGSGKKFKFCCGG